MARTCAPGMRAASSSGEPATESLVPAATKTGRATAGGCTASRGLRRAAHAGGERPQIGFGQVGEGAERVARGIGHLRERGRFERLRNHVGLQPYSADETTTDAAKHGGTHMVGIGNREE